MTTWTCVRVARNTRNLLADIARHEGVSMAQLVAAMANAEADAIGDDISSPPDIGIGIWRASAGGQPNVVLSMDAAPLVVLNPDEAKLLASQLDRAVTARSRFGLITQLAHRQVVVFRRGRGVVVGIDGSERAFTTGSVRDIARALRSCTEPAKGVSTPSVGAASATSTVPRAAPTPASDGAGAEGWVVSYSPNAKAVPPPGYYDIHGVSALADRPSRKKSRKPNLKRSAPDRELCGPRLQ